MKPRIIVHYQSDAPHLYNRSMFRFNKALLHNPFLPQPLESEVAIRLKLGAAARLNFLAEVVS